MNQLISFSGHTHLVHQGSQILHQSKTLPMNYIINSQQQHRQNQSKMTKIVQSFKLPKIFWLLLSITPNPCHPIPFQPWQDWEWEITIYHQAA